MLMKYLLNLHESVFVSSAHAEQKLDQPWLDLVDLTKLKIHVFDKRAVTGFSVRLSYSGLDLTRILLLLGGDKVCTDLEEDNCSEYICNFG